MFYFLLGAADQEIEEIEKTWEVLTSEEVISMFVTGAVISVEDKVKSR